MIKVNTTLHTDIKRLKWMERILPAAMHPYLYLMRLDRPIGIWLLLLPGLWSIALASTSFSTNTYKTIILFFIGAIIMRGAGCVVNDLWDRDLDIQVERTKNRPLASGTIVPQKALVFLATLLLLGFFILIQFNIITILLGSLSLPLIASYPLMKRITWWPQAFLGLTFNFSALMGWTAITSTLTPPAIMIYMAGIFWTLGYDTIYAHQDKEDDMRIGIKSTALKFGTDSKKYVVIFYGLTLAWIFSAHTYINGLSLLSAIILLPTLHFAWQLNRWETSNSENTLRIFKSNTITGLLILAFLAI